MRDAESEDQEQWNRGGDDSSGESDRGPFNDGETAIAPPRSQTRKYKAMV